MYVINVIITIYLFFRSGFWCVCSGLLVGPVRLTHKRRYISYELGPSERNSLIECPYVLETSEEVVSKIEWELLEGEGGEPVGTFVWHAESREAEGGLSIFLFVFLLELY